MHATELRIGNLLYFKNTDMVAKVQLINAPKHYDCRDEFGSFVPNGEYEPIPLTEDWLLRFGFIVREKTVSLNVGGELMRYAFYEEMREDKRICFVIYYSKRNGWTLDSITSNKETVYFNSVHQLQNIFFTNVGEELTLKTE